jgi:hypothetical protein
MQSRFDGQFTSFLGYYYGSICIRYHCEAPSIMVKGYYMKSGHRVLLQPIPGTTQAGSVLDQN